jgi:hypothetical protein
MVGRPRKSRGHGRPARGLTSFLGGRLKFPVQIEFLGAIFVMKNAGLTPRMRKYTETLIPMTRAMVRRRAKGRLGWPGGPGGIWAPAPLRPGE